MGEESSAISSILLAVWDVTSRALQKPALLWRWFNYKCPSRSPKLSLFLKRELVMTKSACINWASWRRAAGRGVGRIANEAEETENRKYGMSREGAKLLSHNLLLVQKLTEVLGTASSWILAFLNAWPPPRGATNLPQSHQPANPTPEKQEKKEQRAIL